MGMSGFLYSSVALDVQGSMDRSVGRLTPSDDPDPQGGKTSR
jgi:hypothetical protein